MSELKTTLREVDQSKYPDLSDYTKDDIWRDIGPGGLYLVSLLAKELSLQPDSLVLDLGYGACSQPLTTPAQSAAYQTDGDVRSSARKRPPAGGSSAAPLGAIETIGSKPE